MADRFYPDPKKYYYFAEFLYEAKNYAAAEKAILKFLDYNPGSKNGNLQAGVILGEGGKAGEALKYFDNILKKYPDDTLALNNKAKVFFMLGRKKEAVDVYKRVVALSPGDEVAAQNLKALQK